MSDARTQKNSDSSKKVTTVSTTDSTLRDLQERYNMDEEIWNKSKRGFPFNIPLWAIITFALGLPFVTSLVYFDFSNQYLWKVYLFTIAISIVAYFVTASAIEQFKESLQKNGLAGKDLNKAGERDKKPPV